MERQEVFSKKIQKLGCRNLSSFCLGVVGTKLVFLVLFSILVAVPESSAVETASGDAFPKFPPGRQSFLPLQQDGELAFRKVVVIFETKPCQKISEWVRRRIEDEFRFNFEEKAEGGGNSHTTETLTVTSPTHEFSFLHAVAADITARYRQEGRACSAAVVWRVTDKSQVGIRICELDEGEEDCLCSARHVEK